MRFKPDSNGIWDGKHPHSRCYIRYSIDDSSSDIVIIHSDEAIHFLDITGVAAGD
jgi:hypothetical protein